MKINYTTRAIPPDLFSVTKEPDTFLQVLKICERFGIKWNSGNDATELYLHYLSYEYTTGIQCRNKRLTIIPSSKPAGIEYTGKEFITKFGKHEN